VFIPRDAIFFGVFLLDVSSDFLSTDFLAPAYIVVYSYSTLRHLLYILFVKFNSFIFNLQFPSIDQALIDRAK